MHPYLDPTAPIAPDAILTDDPKGAMDLAVALCDTPRMSNLAHGLWGYHGKTREGAELTIQSLGIGGPSAAAVMADLGRLGVVRAIRIGSCIGLNEALEPGSGLVATSIEPADGAGVALANGHPVQLDAALTEALVHSLGGSLLGRVRSTDLHSSEPASGGDVVAADLSSAAFAAAGARDGIACACALIVAVSAGSPPLERETLDEALIGLGARAAAALSAVAQASGS